jgi:hypothetical protein
LGSAIAEHGTGPEALPAYERDAASARRCPSDAPVPQAASRTCARVAARDALVRRTPDGARYRQLDAAIGAH